jgi:hypothetical protein
MRLHFFVPLGALSVTAAIVAACGGGNSTMQASGAGGGNGSASHASVSASSTGVGAASSSTTSSSGAPDAGPDVDNGMPSTDYPAPHPAAPQVINLMSGTVLSAPKLVPVFFANEDPTMQASLIDFVNNIGNTPDGGAGDAGDFYYWPTTTSE